jgi:glucoamylase
MGWLELGESTARSLSFDLVLGLGGSQAEALQAASATLADDLNAVQTRYDQGWHRYAASLSNQGGSADDRYYLAAMTLKTLQDKETGAMVAGLGTPWGDSQGEGNSGGYHLVWPRDLYKYANALYTAGDRASPARVVRYLFETLQQKTDCGQAEYQAPGCPMGYSRAGRFPQNAWVDGRPYWQGSQMDQQAMPILLAWRLGPAVYGPLWPSIRLTAEYLLRAGPRTMQERWEENGGYSPSTLAAEIAGLVAAADMARQQGDSASAARYLARADAWRRSLEAWTFTRTGPLGGGQYYLRINPAPAGPDGAPTLGPDDAQMLKLANGGGERDARSVIDSGFMELVRLGVKSADDPALSSTLAVFDRQLGQQLPLPGAGELARNAWFRYNFDGYGEHNDGRDFDGTGRGRLWPILTAERGMLEIARQGNGAAGVPYLRALRQFATPEGFLPEQVWPQSTVLAGGWQVDTPANAAPGAPTRSISPLGWAMGEYISLLASIHAGRVVDMPSVVCLRYGQCQAPPARAGQ